MPIDLPKEIQEEAIASIQSYFLDYMDKPIGNIAAGALFQFFLEEVGPSVYNKAIADVQERLQARILELDIELHEVEFPSWRRSERGR